MVEAPFLGGKGTKSNNAYFKNDNMAGKDFTTKKSKKSSQTSQLHQNILVNIIIYAFESIPFFMRYYGWKKPSCRGGHPKIITQTIKKWG